MPSQNDIDHMANLMAIMNGQQPTKKVINESLTPYVPDEGVDPTDDMKKILSRMYESSSGEVIKESKIDNKPSLQEQYTVRVGLKEGSKTRKLYSVVNGNQIITEGLYLFESAYLITHYLNEGYDSSNKLVIKIKEQDDEYKDVIKEASILKSRINKCIQLNESEARGIFERKFKLAKTEASSIQELLKSKLDDIS